MDNNIDKFMGILIPDELQTPLEIPSDEVKQKVKELTSFFVDKVGDKIIVEIEITDNPDEVIKQLSLSLHKDLDIISGAKVTQIYFKNFNENSLIIESTKKLIENFKKELDLLKSKI